MNKKEQEEDALEEALSPIVNRLIDKNYETSQDKIAMQMAPLIGGAIREQIKSQKDDVVDALYPVLGNMISRYVTKMLEDMLNKINTQIQDGLSVEAIKRKIRAKIQGVSESQLLLNENSTTTIRAILLIHKETGIVLAHSENPNTPVSEPEMLASMMTAIRSFVNDWIEQNSDAQELGEIEYGSNKIIIEASGYSYLAVIVEGSVHQEVYSYIRKTLENILLKSGDSIRKFNGDLSNFENLEIYRELTALFKSALHHETKEEEKEKKSIHPLLFLLPALLFLWGGFSYYTSYKDEILTQKVTKQLTQTPQLVAYKFEVLTEDSTVTLKGVVPFEYHKNLAQTLLENITDIKEIHNELLVNDSLQDPMQISSNIAYLLRGLNTLEDVALTYTYDYSVLKIQGSVPNTKTLQKVKKEIQNIQNIQNVHYEVSITPPPLNATVYFDKSSTQLSVEAQKTLFKAAKIVQKLDPQYKIKLTAYSDTLGSATKNYHLSQQRVKNVVDFLQNVATIRREFVSLIKNTPPDDVDAIKEPDKARCIRITYTKKEDNASL